MVRRKLREVCTNCLTMKFNWAGKGTKTRLEDSRIVGGGCMSGVDQIPKFPIIVRILEMGILGSKTGFRESKT